MHMVTPFSLLSLSSSTFAFFAFALSLFFLFVCSALILGVPYNFLLFNILAIFVLLEFTKSPPFSF